MTLETWLNEARALEVSETQAKDIKSSGNADAILPQPPQAKKKCSNCVLRCLRLFILFRKPLRGIKPGFAYITTIQGNNLAKLLPWKSTKLQDSSVLKSQSAISWPICQYKSDEAIVPDPLSSIPMRITLALGIPVKATKRNQYRPDEAIVSNPLSSIPSHITVFALGLPANVTKRRYCKTSMRLLCNSANLVNIRCEPFLNILNHSLSLCLMNTQSVRNKTADFVDYICEQAFDLVAVPETWLIAIEFE